MEQIYCFKHCSNSVSIFYHKNKFPTLCPTCKLSLENVSFLLEPFCVPSQFWNGNHIQSVSLLLKPIPSGKRLVDSNNSCILKVSYNFSHHIGVVTPCNQRVYHYDTDGVTWDYLMSENSQWLGAIVIPFSSPTNGRSSNQIIADLTDQAAWSSERCVHEIM